MVSLENRIDYLSRIDENQKLKAFNNLLLAKDIIIPENQDLNESGEIYFGIINAIQKSNKSDFEKKYGKKSQSKPNKDSLAPFVNDDFLIFSLIVGVVKFDIDKSWLKSIVSVRVRNPITITFENILNENYYSKSNLPEIVFMFLKLIDLKLIENEFVNFTFEKVTTNVKLFESRSDFQILCSLRAYDTIFLLKELPDKRELEIFKKFNNRFKKRITYLSVTIQVILFAFLIYLLLKLPKYSPEAIVLINKYNYIFTIIGALGLSFLGNSIPIFRNISKKLIMRMFGYPSDLLKDI